MNLNPLNHGTAIGRLTKDVEIKTSASGKKFAFITIAIGRNYKGNDDNYGTDFVSFIAGETTAEFLAGNFHKGDMVAITYELKSGTKEVDGKKVSFENKQVIGVNFVPGTKKNATATETTDKTTDEPASEKEPDFAEISDDDDDLPF